MDWKHQLRELLKVHDGLREEYPEQGGLPEYGSPEFEAEGDWVEARSELAEQVLILVLQYRDEILSGE